MDELAKGMGVSLDKIKDILAANRIPLSLDTPMGRMKTIHSRNWWKTKPPLDREDSLEANLMSADIRGILSTLTSREREVLVLRFGLNDGKPRTLEQVGRLVGITRERTRQIELKALRALRQSKVTSKLKDYLTG